MLLVNNFWGLRRGWKVRVFSGGKTFWLFWPCLRSRRVAAVLDPEHLILDTIIPHYHVRGEKLAALRSYLQLIVECICNVVLKRHICYYLPISMGHKTY